MKVYFSILSYHPSFITNEAINVGVLFHCEDTGEKTLEVTSKWQRVKSFDDELNIDFFKAVLGGIQDEIKEFKIDTVKFDIFKYTRRYVNELKFSRVKVAEVDDLESFIKETKQIFLRFDFDKKDRPNKQKQLSYIKKLLRDTNVKLENGKSLGEYNEYVNYDYIIGNIGFKIFTFSNKDLGKLITSAKSWSFTAAEMLESKGLKTVFIYDIESKEEKFNIIYNILNKSAFRILDVSDAIDYIVELNYKNEKQIDFYELVN